MLKLKILIFWIFFLFSKLQAEETFLSCEEKISEIRLDNNFIYNEGDIIGTSIIKINLNKDKPKITIYFRNLKNYKKIEKIVQNKQGYSTSLGFDLKHNISNTKDNSSEYEYNFMKFDNFYTLTKKINRWKIKTSNSAEEKYDYTSVSKCKNLKKNEYLKILKRENNSIKIEEDEYKWNGKKVSKETFCNNARNAKMPKYYPEKYKLKCETNNKIKKKTKTKKNTNKTIKGTRSFALSWEGYDENILGTLKFNEENLVGKIEFKLSDDNPCFGTYVISEEKGTWSLLCKKNEINASGFLRLNKQTGEISGNGKDNEDNNIKFKIID